MHAEPCWSASYPDLGGALSQPLVKAYTFVAASLAPHPGVETSGPCVFAQALLEDFHAPAPARLLLIRLLRLLLLLFRRRLLRATLVLLCALSSRSSGNLKRSSISKCESQ